MVEYTGPAASYNITYTPIGDLTSTSGVTGWPADTTGSSTSNPGNPTASGYTFKGWFSDASGNTAMSWGSISADTTVYGKWVKNKYSLSLSGGGAGLSPTSVDAGGTATFSVTAPAGQNASITVGGAGGTVSPNSVTGGSTATITYTAPSTAPSSESTLVTINVSFAAGSYAITYTPIGALTGSAGTSGGVTGWPNNSSGNSIANPGTPSRSGYTFKGWFRDSAGTSQITSWPMSITSATTIYGKWAQNKYTLTLSAGTNGTATGLNPTSVAAGGTATFTVSPNSGYTASFADGGKGGSFSQSGSTVTYTAPSAAPASESTPITLSVSFGAGSFNVTTSVSPSGAGTVTGGGSYTMGASVSLTASNTRGTFKNWTLSGASVSNPNNASISFNMPGNNVTATANYYNAVGNTSITAQSAPAVNTTSSNPTVTQPTGASGSAAWSKTTQWNAGDTPSITYTYTASTATNYIFPTDYSVSVTGLPSGATQTQNRSSDGSTYTVTVTYPRIGAQSLPAPSGTPTLAISGANVGSQINFTAGWNTVANASGYEITLLNGSTTAGTYTVTGQTTNTYTMTNAVSNAGSYTVKVKALGSGNYANSGDSAASSAIAIGKLTASTANASQGSVSVTNASGTALSSTLYGQSGQSVNVTATPAGGYSFHKWNDNTTTNPKSFTFGSSAATVTASFQTSYVLSYDLGGATGTAPASVTLPSSSPTTTVTSTTPTWADHRFVSWGGYAPGASITLTANKTLVAQWKNTYTVAFDANGGSGTASSQTGKAVGDSLTMPGGPTRSGYVFKGWSTNSSAASGATGSYTLGAGDVGSAAAGATITFYATWAAQTYAVTYSGGSGTTGSAPTEANHASGDTFAVKGNGTLAWANHRFKNWSYGGTDYSAGASFTMPGSAVTFTPNWIDLYGVTFDLNYTGGGTMSGSTTNNQYAAGEVITFPTQPTRAGFTFQGWSTTSSGTAQASIAMVAQSTAGAKMTVYAIWAVDSTAYTWNLASPSAATYATSYTGSFNAATGPYGVTFTYSATGLPAGLNINSSSRQITGTPTCAPGVYTATFTASASTGATLTRTVNITVNKKNISSELSTAVGTAGSYTYNGTPQGLAKPATNVTISGGVAVTPADLTADYVGTTAAGTSYSSTNLPTDAGNYTLTVEVSSSNAYYTGRTTKPFTIGKKALSWGTPTAPTATSKPYDGNTNFPTAGATLSVSGTVAGDTITVSLPANGTLNNKHAGTGKSVTVAASNITLSGPVDNYTKPTGSVTLTSTAEVTKKTVTLVPGTHSKQYDGTTALPSTLSALNGAAATTSNVTGFVSGDSAYISLTGGALDNKDVGSRNATGMTIGMTGSDAGNYQFSAVSSIPVTVNKANLGNVTPNPLSVPSGYTYGSAKNMLSFAGVNGETFTAADGTFTWTGSSGPDSSSISGSSMSFTFNPTSGNYNQKGYTVNVNNSVSPITVTIGGGNLTKVYGDSDFPMAATVTGVPAGGDTGVTWSSSDPTIASIDASGNIHILKAGGPITIRATSKETASVSDSVTLTVQKRAITVAGTGSISKVYDAGTTITSPGVTLTVSGATSTDATGLQSQVSSAASSAAYAFLDKNVGSGKPVKVTALNLGSYATNYAITNDANGSQVSGLTGSITAKPVTLVMKTVSKVYDGTNALPSDINSNFSNYVATAPLIESGDSVGYNVTGNYSTQNVIANDTSMLLNVALTGSDAGNYSLSTSYNLTKGAITQATLSGISETLSVTHVTTYGGNNGSINGLAGSKSYEYKKTLDADGNSVTDTWHTVPASSTSIPNLYAGEYQVRYTANANQVAGAATTLTINQPQVFAATITLTGQVATDGRASSQQVTLKSGSTIIVANWDSGSSTFKATNLDNATTYTVYVNNIPSTETVSQLSANASVNCYKVEHDATSTGEVTSLAISARAGGVNVSNNGYVPAGTAVTFSLSALPGAGYTVAWQSPASGNQQTASVTYSAAQSKVACQVNGNNYTAEITTRVDGTASPLQSPATVQFVPTSGGTTVSGVYSGGKYVGTLVKGTTYNVMVGGVNRGAVSQSSTSLTLDYYTVKFNRNGPGALITDQQVFSGEKATAPSVTAASGQQLDGWYKQSDLTGSAWNFSSDTVTSGPMTLYAKWKNVISAVSITGLQPVTDGTPVWSVSGTGFTGTVTSWNEQGGGALSTSSTFQGNKVYSAVVKLTAASGYEFASSVAVTASGAQSVTNPATPAGDGTITVTIIFQPTSVADMVSVMYDANVAPGVSVADMPAAKSDPKGSNFALTGNPTRSDGYDFAGWMAGPSDTATITSLTNVQANTTVYAKWEEHNYNIAYQPGNGTNLNSKATYKVTELPITLQAPYPASGYTFEGWYFDAAFNNPLSGSDKRIIPTGTVGDLTLYAKYKAPALSSVGATVTAPAVDAAFQSASPVDSTKYGATDTKWRDVLSGNVLSGSDRFQPGRTYEVVITLTGNGGNTFANGVTATVNGQAASVQPTGTTQPTSTIVITKVFPPVSEKLSDPVSVVWGSGSNSNIATWTWTPDTTNKPSMVPDRFELKLYKNGTAVAAITPTVNYTAGTTSYSYDFSGILATNGPDSYQFGVKAVSDTAGILASNEVRSTSPNSYQAKLATPTNLHWGTTPTTAYTAYWTHDGTAAGYKVELLQKQPGGNYTVVATENLTGPGSTYFDFQTAIENIAIQAAGTYNFHFKVTAMPAAGDVSHLPSDSAENSTDATYITYQVTVQANPSSAGSITSPAINPGVYRKDAVVAITAVANAGNRFNGWTLVGGTGGSIADAASATTSFTVSGNATVQANFQTVQVPTINPSSVTFDKNPANTAEFKDVVVRINPGDYPFDEAHSTAQGKMTIDGTTQPVPFAYTYDPVQSTLTIHRSFLATLDKDQNYTVDFYFDGYMNGSNPQSVPLTIAVKDTTPQQLSGVEVQMPTDPEVTYSSGTNNSGIISATGNATPVSTGFTVVSTVWSDKMGQVANSGRWDYGCVPQAVVTLRATDPSTANFKGFKNGDIDVKYNPGPATVSQVTPSASGDTVTFTVTYGLMANGAATPLPAPTNAHWTTTQDNPGGTAVATWDPVPNATAYLIEVYDQSGTYPTSIQVNGSATSRDLWNVVQQGGSGTYRFEVFAVGDGTTTRNSSTSAKSANYAGSQDDRYYKYGEALKERVDLAGVPVIGNIAAAMYQPGNATSALTYKFYASADATLNTLAAIEAATAITNPQGNNSELKLTDTSLIGKYIYVVVDNSTEKGKLTAGPVGPVTAGKQGPVEGVTTTDVTTPGGNGSLSGLTTGVNAGKPIEILDPDTGTWSTVTSNTINKPAGSYRLRYKETSSLAAGPETPFVIQEGSVPFTAKLNVTIDGVKATAGNLTSVTICDASGAVIDTATCNADGYWYGTTTLRPGGDYTVYVDGQKTETKVTNGSTTAVELFEVKHAATVTNTGDKTVNITATTPNGFITDATDTSRRYVPKYTNVTFSLSGDTSGLNFSWGGGASGNGTSTSVEYRSKRNEVTCTTYTPGGGGGGIVMGETSEITLTYEAGKYGTIPRNQQTEKLAKTGPAEKVPTPKVKEGYTHLGWTIDKKEIVDPTKLTLMADTDFLAVYKDPDGRIIAADGTVMREAGQHKTYIKGYPDGTFQAGNSITRGETVAMLSRLTDGFTEGTLYGHPFPDVASDIWYAPYVGFAYQHNIVQGYPDGSFHAEAYITRAEFAAIIARFMGLAPSGTSSFPDVDPANWASGYIAVLEETGIINGYVDGTFRPDQLIARSEAVKMINGAVGRTPTPEQVEENLSKHSIPFPDITPSYWAYYEILEAVIDHEISDFH